MSEWISVTDRLPPINTDVLCFIDNEIYCGYVVLRRLKSEENNVWQATIWAKQGNDRYLWSFTPGFRYSNMVTHWMPILVPHKHDV